MAANLSLPPLEPRGPIEFRNAPSLATTSEFTIYLPAVLHKPRLGQGEGTISVPRVAVRYATGGRHADGPPGYYGDKCWNPTGGNPPVVVAAVHTDKSGHDGGGGGTRWSGDHKWGVPAAEGVGLRLAPIPMLAEVCLVRAGTAPRPRDDIPAQQGFKLAPMLGLEAPPQNVTLPPIKHLLAPGPVQGEVQGGLVGTTVVVATEEKTGWWFEWPEGFQQQQGLLRIAEWVGEGEYHLWVKIRGFADGIAVSEVMSDGFRIDRPEEEARHADRDLRRFFDRYLGQDLRRDLPPDVDLDMESDETLAGDREGERESEQCAEAEERRSDGNAAQ